MPGIHAARWRPQRLINRLQTAVMVLALPGIAASAGTLLSGENSLWLALLAVLVVLVFEPAAASRLTLRL